MADVGAYNASNRLCVFDRHTRERFLVDTGAEISVLAAKNKAKRSTSSFTLYAANNTPITTYGEKSITLDLGLRRVFRWTFIIADVKTSIIGADFLRYFKLLVDLHKKKLLDEVTNLAINTLSIRSNEPTTLYCVDKSHPYYDLLSKYPEIPRPMSTKQPPSHDITHELQPRGPPLFGRPRPLPPDRYIEVKKEFERLVEMGVCRPSRSPWASPIHVVKKNNGQLRICGDYRRLNAVTVPDPLIPHTKNPKLHLQTSQ